MTVKYNQLDKGHNRWRNETRSAGRWTSDVTAVGIEYRSCL